MAKPNRWRACSKSISILKLKVLRTVINNIIRKDRRPRLRVYTFPSNTSSQYRLLTCKLRLLKVTEPEVYNLYMPLTINNDIFRLKISINDTILMHPLNGQQKLCGVKLGPFHIEVLRFSDMKEQVPTIDILHNEVKVVFLENVSVHFDNKGWALKLLHDLELLC